MTSSDMLTINIVAAKLGLSVHQLRRWELMFGLEIKRGRGQQRQYREEDMSVLERIKELVEQGWPTSQIRPQLEAEGLLTPKLIGMPPNPGNPEVLQEAIIGLRNFSERRFIDLSKQIDELRQLLISVTLKQELSADRSSPWQPMASEYVPAPKAMPPQEITIGPQISIDPPKSPSLPGSMTGSPQRVNQIPPPPSATQGFGSSSSSTSSAPPSTSSSAQNNALGSSSNSDFSQRSMMSSANSSASNSSTGNPSIIGSSSSAQNKTTIPDIDQAPKPITDALQRSMSTLDSLFKDPRNTPGAGADRESGISSSSSLPAVPPVRHSTIPPQPSDQSGDLPDSQPAAAPSQTAPGGDSSSTPTASITLSQASSLTQSDSNFSPIESLPDSSAISQFSLSQTTPPATAATPNTPTPTEPPSTAWDQAFASTSVDINAVPSSGLFEDTSRSTKNPDSGYAEPKFGPGSGSSPSFSNLSKPEVERNPFTTITGTNTDAIGSKPTDSGSHPLMGQTEGSRQGFNAYGQNLAQTGPLPAHTSVESFAPEQKEQLIESQSSSTSTELPQTANETPPAPVLTPPVLPMPAGPQVNFGPNVSAPTPQVTPQRLDDNFGLGEVTDQNYLTVLGRALDLIGWSDEQADSYSLKTFGVPHWDELGRSQAEKLVAHLVSLLKDQLAQ